MALRTILCSSIRPWDALKCHHSLKVFCQHSDQSYLLNMSLTLQRNYTKICFLGCCPKRESSTRETCTLSFASRARASCHKISAWLGASLSFVEQGANLCGQFCSTSTWVCSACRPCGTDWFIRELASAKNGVCTTQCYVTTAELHFNRVTKRSAVTEGDKWWWQCQILPSIPPWAKYAWQNPQNCFWLARYWNVMTIQRLAVISDTIVQTNNDLLLGNHTRNRENNVLMK